MELLNVLELLDLSSSFERKLNLALRYTGLRLPQFRAMEFLNKSGKITVSDLSRHFNVTRATTSTMVNQLIAAGIVESLSHRSDKRSFYIRLTDAGLRRFELARIEVEGVVRNLSRRYPEEAIRQVNRLSSKIVADS